MLKLRTKLNLCQFTRNSFQIDKSLLLRVDVTGVPLYAT